MAKQNLKTVLEAIDTKKYDFYDDLPEDDKKDISPFVLMRFISNASSNRDIQEWFIEMTNETVNKNHWVLSKNHKSLLWKLLAVNGIGSTVFHPYQAYSTRDKQNKFQQLLAELNPSMKSDEISLMSDLMTDDDKNQLLDDFGFDKKQKKEILQ